MSTFPHRSMTARLLVVCFVAALFSAGCSADDVHPEPSEQPTQTADVSFTPETPSELEAPDDNVTNEDNETPDDAPDEAPNDAPDETPNDDDDDANNNNDDEANNNDDDDDDDANNNNDDDANNNDDDDDANTPKLPPFTPPLLNLCELGNDDCDAGQYCKTNSCADGAVGVCTPKPVKCLVALTDSAICGCDGETYKNVCDAAKEGVNVAYKKACVSLNVKLCKAGADDCGEGQYCKANSCAKGASGICVTKPVKCLIQPDDATVCGCDGKTYANACDAAQDGVTVDAVGSCKPKACIIGFTFCGQGRYCEAAAGTCTKVGVCKDKPALITAAILPVCGCDGKTYKNDSQRRAAGVSLDHKGVCTKNLPQLCNMGGDDCAADSYCHAAEGACSGTGVCVKRPTACNSKDLTPVCGCDGSLYVNGCYAALNGQPALPKSACK